MKTPFKLKYKHSAFPFKSPIKYTFSEKVSKLMHEGKPQDQALAITYSMKRRGELEK